MADRLESVFSAQVILPGIDLVNTNLDGLLRAFKRLGADSKKEVAEFQSAFNSLKNAMDRGFIGKDLEEETEKFNKALQALKKTIQTEALLSKGTFSNAEAKNINSFNKLIGELSKAMEGLKKSSKMEQGTLGLDAKNLKAAQSALKDLNTQISALNFSWRDNKGDQALRTQLVTLAQNRAAVRDLVKEYEARNAAQKASQDFSKTWDSAQRENVIFDKKKLISDWKEAIRQNEKEAKESAAHLKELYQGITSGMMPTRNGQSVFKTLTNNIENQSYAIDAAKNRAMMYKVRRQDEASEAFALSSQNQFEYRQNGRNLFSNDPYTRARINAQQQSADEFMLNQAWKSGGGSSTKFASNKIGDTEKIRGITSEILNLQKQMVSLSKQEELTDERRASIISRILSREQERARERQKESHSQKINDPEADQRYIDYQVNKVATRGRGALLQVQAVLQANYAILNTIQSSIRLAITNTVEYEAALKDMQAISGSTNSEMKLLDTTIRGISSSSKFSAVELSDDGKILAQAGMSAREITTALPSVAMLATATGSSLKETVDIVTSVVGVFDKSVSDIPDVANKISSTLNMSKASAESLRLGLSYVGSTAKETGVSLEETLATFGAMTNAGIKSGSTLGTGMRQILVEMQKPSQEFISALGRIGLTVADVDVKSKGWTNTLKTLSDAGFVATDAIKSFDVRGASAFNALLGNSKDIDKIISSYDDHTAALRASEIQMDSLKSQLSLLSNNFIDLATQGLGPTSNALKTFVGFSVEVLQTLKPLSPVIAGLTTVVVSLGVAIVGSLVASTLSAIPALKTLSTEFSAIRTAAIATTATMAVTSEAMLFPKIPLGISLLRSFSGAFSGLGVMVTSLATGIIPALQAALQALFMLIKAHPIITVLTAISIGMAMFGSSSTSAKEKVDTLTTAMNDSEASIEKTNGTLSKIDETIARVSAKQELLKTHTLETSDAKKILSDAANQTNAVLIQFGDTVNSNSTSLSTMVDKLREARAGMVALQSAELDRLSLQAQGLSDAKKGEAKELSKDVSMSKIAQLTDSKDFSKYQKSDQDVLKFFWNHVSTGGQTQDFSQLSKLSNAIDRISQTAYLSESTRGTAKELSGVVDKVAQAVIDSGRALEKRDTINTTKTDHEAINKFYGDRIGLLASSTVLQDSIKGTAKAREVDILKDKGGYLQIGVEESRKLIDSLNGLQEEARLSRLKPNGLTEEQFAAINQDITKAKSSVTSGYTGIASSYGATYQAINKNDIQGLESRIQNMIRGKSSSIDDVRGVLQQKHDLQTKELDLTSGATGSADFNELQRSLKMKQAEEVISVTRQMMDAGREASSRSLSQLKEALQLGIDSERMKADNAFKMVNPFSTVEEVKELATKSLEAFDKAQKLELEKHKRESEARAKRPGFKQGIEDIYLQNLALKQAEDRKAQIQRFREPEMKAWKRDVLGVRENNENNTASNSKEAMLSLQKFKDESASQQVQLRIIRGKSEGMTEDQTQLLQLEQNKQEIAALQIYLTEQEALVNKFKGEVPRISAIIADLEKQKDQKLGTSEEQNRISDQLTTAQQALTEAAKNELQARKEILKTQIEIANKNPIKGQSFDIDTLKKNLEDADSTWRITVASWDINKTISDGLSNTLKNTTSSIGQSMVDLASGTKTLSQAFRSMATSIIKSMLDVIAQAAAMQMVKLVLGIATSGASTTAASSTASGVSGAASSGFSSAFPAAVGGLAVPNGFVYSSKPIQKFAWGGPVRGGVSGKDSVPSLLMPGEFVVKKKAVDVVGESFLHGINQQAEGVVQSSQSEMGTPGKQTGLGGTVNVWVVTPDQKPSSVGPKDIVAAISDDISRDGSVKKLIKQIQMGQ